MQHGDDRTITTIGKTDWRDQGHLFGIKAHDRLGHIYVLGVGSPGTELEFAL